MDIGRKILTWYDGHKRDLPWRNSSDPYTIWVSEIILQQTRVEQGMEYFNRFIQRFPDVESLAGANIDEVLTLWQGLGYYSRARNMHFAANQVMNDFAGRFPTNYEDILSLKGVGEYTAAAIASIAYNQPVACVDGNVNRLVSRIFGIATPVNTGKGKKEISKLALEMMVTGKAGDFNQAMMEFGALQCVPVNPDCKQCVLQADCFAFKEGKVEKFPVKNKKLKVRDRYFFYIHANANSSIFITKRTGKDIWNSLYELPLIETNQPMDPADIFEHETWKRIVAGTSVYNLEISNKVVHVLSHQKLHCYFIKVSMESANDWLNSNYIPVSLEQLEKYAFPRLIQNYLFK